MLHQDSSTPSASPIAPRKGYVLLDRDGTINIDRDYLADPADLELLPGAIEGLTRLQAMGLGLIVVTNQSAIERGYLDLDRLADIHRELERQLAGAGVTLDGIYFCPHRPETGCRCRKPQVELIERASGDFGFDPRDAFVVGDKGSDMRLGLAVGACTILVRTGYGATAQHDPSLHPHYIADDLKDAATFIESVLARRGAAI